VVERCTPLVTSRADADKLKCTLRAWWYTRPLKCASNPNPSHMVTRHRERGPTNHSPLRHEQHATYIWVLAAAPVFLPLQTFSCDEFGSFHDISFPQGRPSKPNLPENFRENDLSTAPKGSLKGLIDIAHNNMRNDHAIDRGGFSDVWEGLLASGKLAAEASDGAKFVMKLRASAQLKHLRVLNSLGYALRESKRNYIPPAWREIGALYNCMAHSTVHDLVDMVFAFHFTARFANLPF